VDPSKHERMIANIYDGALDNLRWLDALLDLAEMTGCAQASLDFYDRSSGFLVNGFNPLIPSESIASYLADWRERFSFWKRHAFQPVGKVTHSDEVFDEDFWAGEFYNEWSRPQKMGRNGRYVNVAATGRTFGQLRACKSLTGADFGRREDRLFKIASGHFIRAVGIHRRLRVAEAQQSAPIAGEAPVGFLIVDGWGRILAAHEDTERCLQAAGLILPQVGGGRVAMEQPGLQRLISGAARPRLDEGPCAGEVEHRGRDGVLLRITVIPIVRSTWGADAWVALDRPAALVCVRRPEDSVRERISRLAVAHGLTAAEAAVAIEAAKGDGRSAVAARLGIRETTVRSHLSAIFGKLGIHRQAELTRLVSGI